LLPRLLVSPPGCSPVRRFTAVASSAGARATAAVHAAQSEPTSRDTDAIQQGDQTSPDTAAAAVARGVKAQSGKTDNSGEAPDSENSGASDGPGGHADLTGTVQHEFDGVE
jgi:hypothetical protein